MDIYKRLKQGMVNPIKYIAEQVGVSEEYVRLVLSGKRNGTLHRDGKGTQIMALAKQFLEDSASEKDNDKS